MRLYSLRVRGYRSYVDALMEFHTNITTIVGENNTGKSTILTAIQKLLSGSSEVQQFDYPYGVPGHLSIELNFWVNAADIDQLFSRYWGMAGMPEELLSTLHGQLQRDGPEICASLRLDNTQRLPNSPPLLSIGTISVDSRLLTESSTGASVTLSTSITDGLLQRLREALKVMAEFRIKSITGQQHGGIESTTGLETVSALLNLKNHPDRKQRERYEEIKSAFNRVFPRYDIEAVHQSPGSQGPDVQFWEDGKSTSISYDLVSAGVHQILTLLTNIIGHSGLIVFIEHPEQHLHPHAMRFVQSILRNSAERNQIIVTTHDSYFVDPDALDGLRRVWWTPRLGTQIFSAAVPESEREHGRIRTRPRDLNNREIAFARAVLLVEDKTQRLFLTTVAKTLGRDLDAHGISVVEAGGENLLRPFGELLTALGIPYVALKDNVWGDDRRYPPDRFFCFAREIERMAQKQGTALPQKREIEDYLEFCGFGERMKTLALEVGENKPRIAEHLAAELSKEEVPPFVDAILLAVINLATAQPFNES